MFSLKLLFYQNISLLNYMLFELLYSIGIYYCDQLFLYWGYERYVVTVNFEVKACRLHGFNKTAARQQCDKQGI